jgi:hypothetical protein
MSLISVVHNLSNDCADEFHFVHRKSIAPREIAWGAARHDITFDVSAVIINAVEPARSVGCAAIGARLANDLHNFIGGKIASIYTLICLAKKNGAAFIGFTVSVLSGPKNNALLWGKVCVSLLAAVTAFFPLSVAHLAFISQPKRAACVFQENISRSWQFLFTSVANAMHRLCGYTSYPAHNKGINMFHTQKQDGPHWELPHAKYPDPK